MLLAQLGKQGIHHLIFPPPVERVLRERNWWSTTELVNLLLSFSIGRDGLLCSGTSKGSPHEILQQRGWSSSLRRRGALQRGWCSSLERGGALVLLLCEVGVLCCVGFHLLPGSPVAVGKNNKNLSPQYPHFTLPYNVNISNSNHIRNNKK